jgi:hypothetical protein
MEQNPHPRLGTIKPNPKTCTQKIKTENPPKISIIETNNKLDLQATPTPCFAHIKRREYACYQEPYRGFDKVGFLGSRCGWVVVLGWMKSTRR